MLDCPDEYRWLFLQIYFDFFFSISGEWGPTKAVKLIGLLPTSHLYPVINAAPDANVNLKEGFWFKKGRIFISLISRNFFLILDKPLTLNMEFEMTRPMLDFLIRLHKNGDDPYDDQGKKRDARYRLEAYEKDCFETIFFMKSEFRKKNS